MDKIAIASDHAGFPLKDQLADYLKEKGFDVLDLGTNNAETSVDYPLEAEKLVHTIKEEKAPRGILVCGSGIGMCMAANRYSFIRAALVYEVNAAHLARQHNDANVLCLGARMTDFETAKKLVDEFLNTPFEGGRHERRILELGGMK